MFYLVKNHSFSDSVLSILQTFFFGETLTKVDEIQKTGTTIKSYLQDNFAVCELYIENKLSFTYNQPLSSTEFEQLRRCIKLSVFKCVKNICDIKIPWGILTGIRPAKKINELRNLNISDCDIKKILANDYLVFDEKIELAMNIASIEQKIIKNNHKNKISIYVGIPFCPTRCIYCSFPSYSISKYSSQIDEYLNCLEKEISYFKSYLSSFEIETIYVGGGTPTSLNEYQFQRLLNIISNNFNLPMLEYTIEAGRADTITKNKLQLMKDFGATRISINPQTMNDETLKLIGRNHLEKQFLETFYLAREVGHTNINTDIILGLLDENEQHLIYTMEKLQELAPESLTVHTLAIKRAAKLKQDFKNIDLNDFYTINNMINISSDYAKNMGLYPYYMYRQKNMIGNLENVGYCKPNFECIYNVQIMEEKQSIIAFGSGASSKFFIKSCNKLERVFNVKSVDDYISRIDEMIYRKQLAFNSFF